MHDPMTLLKKDHQDAKKLLKQLGETEEGKEREALLTELEQALTLHMKIEEEIVYPLVPTTCGEEASIEADVEHGLAREGLTTLRELVAAPGFGAAVDMLLAGITHHVKEEETEILPTMKAELDRETWLDLGEQIAAAKESAMAGSSSRRS